MEKKKILGFYDYTVILTYLGAAFAITGIFCSINYRFLLAIICIVMAGICDMFDGRVAFTKNRNHQERLFGVQIDSMSDLINFGIFPAVFVYMYLDRELLAGIVSGAYILCALIRLSFFNVMETERQEKNDKHGTDYLGIPVTASAFLMPLVYISSELFFEHIGNLFIFLLIILGIGFLSGFRTRSPRKLGLILILILVLIEIAGIIFVALQ